MQNKGPSTIFPIAFLIFVIFAGFTPLIPIAIVGIFLVMISQSAKQTTQRRTTTTRTTYRTSRYSNRDLQAIDVKLREFFKHNSRYLVRDDVYLVPKNNQYTGLKTLYVYKGNNAVCTLDEFGGQFRPMYDEIMANLIKFSQQSDVFDVEATVTPEPKKEEAKQQEPKAPEKKKNEYDSAEKYIAAINTLNVEIPNEEITNGLYESCSLLKQISAIENKFPDSKPKLEKLYQYYLPILLNILENYKNLQTAQQHEEFKRVEGRLTSTIKSINEAMKKISSSLCDDDFINLSADITTLEALLKRDGLSNDGLVMNKPGTNNDDK